jgi:hypothetical protein
MRRRLALLLPALSLSLALSLALLGSAFIVGPAQNASAQTGTPSRPEFITGTGDRTSPHVVTYDAMGHALSGFMAFGGRPVGARVASGDVNGDIQPEIVVGVGSGEASFVSIFSMNGAFMGGFSPYGGFPGGVNVAVGDVDGDAVDEIITAAGPGGGPHVIVWDWNSNGIATPKFGWYAYDPNFKGGVNISAFDLVNSARADIVTAPGAGGGPHVRVWDLGSNAPVEDAGWMAYDSRFTGGVSVAGGEIDGARAVVTGAGPGGGPDVRVFSTHGALQHEFYAYDPNFHGGVNVIFSTAQGGDLGHIITAPASWGGPHVRGFTSSGQELFGFMAYGGAVINGINLARVPQLGSTNNTNQNGSNSSG